MQTKPKLQLDEKQIKRLASIHCTNEEIAAVMNCGINTLRRYRQLIEEGRAEGKASLKRRMWQCAMGFTEEKSATFKRKRTVITIKDGLPVKEVFEEEMPAVDRKHTYEPNTGMQQWLSRNLLGYKGEPEERVDGGNSETVKKIVWISESRPGEEAPKTDEPAPVDNSAYDQNG